MSSAIRRSQLRDRRPRRADGWLVRRSKLSPKKRAIAAAGNDVATSAPPVQGRNNVVATTSSAGATTAAAQTERSTRWRRR